MSHMEAVRRGVKANVKCSPARIHQFLYLFLIGELGQQRPCLQLNGDWVDTEWMFRNVDSDYKVIIVGDAAMAPEELYSTSGNYRGPNPSMSSSVSGMSSLLENCRSFRNAI